MQVCVTVIVIHVPASHLNGDMILGFTTCVFMEFDGFVCICNYVRFSF